MEHERQTFHDKVKMPGDHSTHLALSMPTAINNRSAHLHLGITVEPLLAQHGEECGKEGSGQTRVKDGLDMDNGGIKIWDLRESGSVTSWGIPERNIGDDCEEGVAHLYIVRVEVALDVDNESRCDRREQTGLPPEKNKLAPYRG